MNPIESLTQAFYLIVLTGFFIVALELGLYAALTFYRRPWFWPVGVFAGGAVGVFFAPAEFSLSYWGIVGVVTSALLCLFVFGIRGRYRFPFLMLAPAFVMIAAVIIYPFFFQLRIAFSKLNMYTVARWIDTGELGWVGFTNFVNIFVQSPLQTATFWELLWRTVLWTLVNVVFHVGVGLGLAILLNRHIRFKGIYRTILIIPWAMPQVVSVLAWRGEFHPSFGIINQFLQFLHLPTFNWWSEPWPVFISCCLVNIWVGVPFMMIVFLGGLQSIPSSYYEAASIDGASKLRQFKEITIPLLKPVVVPSVTLGTIWTFNNVNVIYLMTGQDGGNEFADILVTALYKSAFTYSRFNFSAALAVAIFLILMGITMVWLRISRGTESVV